MKPSMLASIGRRAAAKSRYSSFLPDAGRTSNMTAIIAPFCWARTYRSLTDRKQEAFEITFLPSVLQKLARLGREQNPGVVELRDQVRAFVAVAHESDLNAARQVGPVDLPDQRPAAFAIQLLEGVNLGADAGQPQAAVVAPGLQLEVG